MLRVAGGSQGNTRRSQSTYGFGLVTPKKAAVAGVLVAADAHRHGVALEVERRVLVRAAVNHPGAHGIGDVPAPSIRSMTEMGLTCWRSRRKCLKAEIASGRRRAATKLWFAKDEPVAAMLVVGEQHQYGSDQDNILMRLLRSNQATLQQWDGCV